MSLNEEQIKQLEQERLALAKKERAEAFLAQQKANAERGWWMFLKARSGQNAVNKGIVYTPNTANNNLMEETIKEMNEQVNEESLEKTFAKLTAEGRLAPYQPGEYTPKTVGTMFLPQTRNEAAAWNTVQPMPANLVGVTKREIRSWSKERLRWESRTPERVKALNTILAAKDN